MNREYDTNSDVIPLFDCVLEYEIQKKKKVSLFLSVWIWLSIQHTQYRLTTYVRVTKLYFKEWKNEVLFRLRNIPAIHSFKLLVF